MRRVVCYENIVALCQPPDGTWTPPRGDWNAAWRYVCLSVLSFQLLIYVCVGMNVCLFVRGA